MPPGTIDISGLVTRTCALSTAARPGRCSNDYKALQNVRTGRSPWYRPLVRSRRLEATLFLASLALTAGCSKDDVKGDRPPPPPPPSAASQSDACASGGGQDTDAISAPLRAPRAPEGYCLDPQSEPQDLRRQGQALDGRGVYDGVRRRVRGLQALRSRARGRAPVRRRQRRAQQRRGEPVALQRRRTAPTRCSPSASSPTRDPAPPRSGRSRPAPPGRRAAATRTSGAGQYLAELTFVTEDTKMTPAADGAGQRARARARSRRRSATKLPGATDLPARRRGAAGRLAHPARHRVLPEGRAGPARASAPIAVGYYKDGEKRWRAVATIRADADGAKEALPRLQAPAGRAPGEGPGRRGRAGGRAGGARPREGRVRRRPQGRRRRGVGDEEMVLDPATPSDKLAPLKLTKDEKAAEAAEPDAVGLK